VRRRGLRGPCTDAGGQGPAQPEEKSRYDGPLACGGEKSNSKLSRITTTTNLLVLDKVRLQLPEALQEALDVQFRHYYCIVTVRKIDIIQKWDAPQL